MDVLGPGARHNGMAAMRRGSYDDTTACVRPHLRSLAQRRRSAPSLAFGKALGMPWLPIREEGLCWVTAEQSPFVLGLSSENGELLLDERVQVTEGSKTRERHIFLFSDVIVFAKIKSSASYRLKQRVGLADMWLYGFDDEPEDEDTLGDIDLCVTLVLAWDLTFCMVSFRSPEVKEHWLDTLHSKIQESKERAGCTFPPPSVLMKVLTSSITSKTLTGGGMMEPFIEFPLDGDAKISTLSKPLCNPEDKLPQTVENPSKWSILTRLRRSSGLSILSHSTETELKTKLFGQPLCRICPDENLLPKSVMDMLVLLWKKGPAMEGVFRKSGNSKNMKAIKDLLNSGQEVDMDDQTAVLLAGLLKSFLKELPGSLLVSELYDTWMEALDSEDAQQRTSEIKRVIDKLPGPNRLLLHYLLSVLCHILESAETNKMDARNLAVCIAPTLLQLDTTPLDEQKGKVDKVTELTQFLIEHCCEMLGENPLNIPADTDEEHSDSMFSQHHDSAYDSTDADGDTGGAPGSSPSPPSPPSPSPPAPCAAAPPGPCDAMFHAFAKPEYSRRRSEPIIFPSAELGTLRGLARSHDDCSAEREDFEEHPLKKQISDDSFLMAGKGGAKAALSLPKLGDTLKMERAQGIRDDSAKDLSCSSSCSLESATSNHSEGSVFTSSPLVSPVCPRRVHSAKPKKDLARTESEGMKRSRSQSMRTEHKKPVRTKSVGNFFLRGSLKKGDAQKERPFPCGTLQEDSQSEAELVLKPRPLSAVEVFRQIDGKLPSGPPSYERAVQSGGLPAPPRYRAMTVQDARELGRRSRPTSVNEDFLSALPVNQYADCFAQVAEDKDNNSAQSFPFRQRAMSESAFRAQHEALSRRCSQPVFEEYSYAKESYV